MTTTKNSNVRRVFVLGITILPIIIIILVSIVTDTQELLYSVGHLTVYLFLFIILYFQVKYHVLDYDIIIDKDKVFVKRWLGSPKEVNCKNIDVIPVPLIIGGINQFKITIDGKIYICMFNYGSTFELFFSRKKRALEIKKHLESVGSRYRTKN